MLRRRRSSLSAATERATGRPRAVVHRSQDREGRLCADAIAEVLQGSWRRFDVAFAGPAGTHPLSEELLATADLYVQPGGGTLHRAYRRLRPDRAIVRAYVGAGGRYLGICLGGYLAGATPGFDLLPGDTDRYIDLPDAEVRHDGESVIPVVWRGAERLVYFQDGPHFVVDEDDVEVVARYRNGVIAALVAPFGSGRVAVCGPHPEASPDWFEDLPVGPSLPRCTDLIEDLMGSLLPPGAPGVGSTDPGALRSSAGRQRGRLRR